MIDWSTVGKDAGAVGIFLVLCTAWNTVFYFLGVEEVGWNPILTFQNEPMVSVVLAFYAVVGTTVMIIGIGAVIDMVLKVVDRYTEEVDV